ncbi:DUF5753 domain-containing protein [Streptomyces tendae]|uniref:DUF5753 domain-containing protein n=1 Tax=Streptomyces tendae TaxID=1932 RepID=UPI0037103C3C
MPPAEASDSLKAFRKRAGLTQEEFAPRVRYSTLDAFGALRGAARHLSRQPGLASRFRQWARFEAEAVSLYTYECRVVPGLLQTEGYARAVTVSVPPVKGDEQVTQQVTARLDRHELFRRKPPISFSFIIEQALIERGTGGPEVTRPLIDNLLARADQFNVELQVMPLRQVDHAGFDGPLQVLETAENRWFGYAEGQHGGLLISDEVASCPETVHVRDSKVRQGAQLAVSPAARTRFLSSTGVHEMTERSRTLATS